MSGRPVEAYKTTKYGEPDVASSTAVGRAIDWLQSYVNENPYSDAANEACSIINGLKTVHHRSRSRRLAGAYRENCEDRSGFAGN